MLTMTALPPLSFGPGALTQVPETLAAIASPGTVAVLADTALTDTRPFAELLAGLKAHGFAPRVRTPAPGEPEARTIAQLSAAARDCSGVIGLGGGSTLDTAKMVALCAPGEADPMCYALNGTPLPPQALPLVAVPTTAGTGSEANGTAVFAGPDHAKLWAAGPALLPAHVVLDPDLTASLPPHLIAWCGLDALVHAFEAATNAQAQPLAQRYALWALAEIPAALPRAMDGDADARAALLLAAFHAGYAIGQSGTALAHCLSHALAAIAPVHHGLATALAFRATLPWVLDQPDARLAPVARAFGLTRPTQIPDLIETLFVRTGMPSHLPEAFWDVTPDQLARHMIAPGCAPMRNATRPEVPDAALPGLARTFLEACSPAAAVAG